MTVSGLRELPGEGLEAIVDGRRYRIGSGNFVAAIAGLSDADGLAGAAMRSVAARGSAVSVEDASVAASMAGDGPGSGTSVWLAAEGRWLARFIIADALRPQAKDVVDAFRARGKKVILLSGDEPALADAVARQLGLLQGHGGYLPRQKLEFVQALQAKGAIVAMVGDGINDAAVLSAADVSFAMGSGAALAQAHADCVLLNSNIGLLAQTADMATKTMRVIRQNLAWATLYNIIAIPAAALGMLNPWLSGVGMAVSSAIVIINALRLRRSTSWKPSTF